MDGGDSDSSEDRDNEPAMDDGARLELTWCGYCYPVIMMMGLSESNPNDFIATLFYNALASGGICHRQDSNIRKCSDC